MSNFTIVYNPNDGISSCSMEPSDVQFGVATRLRKNEYVREGYKFIGWKALRASDNKTCYVNTENKKRKFFTENKHAEGWEPFFYSDEFKIAKLSLVDGDTITMYAQWEKENFVPGTVESNKKIVKNRLYTSNVVLYGGIKECESFYKKYNQKLKICSIMLDSKNELAKATISNIAVSVFNAAKLNKNDYVIICRTVKVRMDNLYKDARFNLTQNGKIVMQDFIRSDVAEVLLNNKKLWLWFGYCQMESLRKDLFQKLDTIKRDFVLTSFRYGLDTVKKSYKFEDCIEMLKISDYLAYVPLVIAEGKMDFAFKDYLPTDAKIVTIPRIPFRGYYPYRNSDMETFFKYTFDGKKHWPIAYQENIIDDLIEAGKSDDEIYKTLMDPDLIPEDKIRKNLKVSCKFIEISEKTTDIKILDYIMENFKKRMVYRDGLHYENFLYFELARRISDFLQLDCVDEINRHEVAVEEQGIQFIDYTEVPVLPCVAKALGLDFVTEETLWRVRFTENGRWLGGQRFMEKMNRKDWIYTYLKYARACITLQDYWNRQTTIEEDSEGL